MGADDSAPPSSSSSEEKRPLVAPRGAAAPLSPLFNGANGVDPGAPACTLQRTSQRFGVAPSSAALEEGRGLAPASPTHGSRPPSGGPASGTPARQPRFWIRLLDWALQRHQRRHASDLGTGLSEHVRRRLRLASLVDSGRYAGLSRVHYEGSNISMHLFLRDFFITVAQQPLWVLMLTAGALYLGIFWFWGVMYYVIVRTRPGCLYGAVTLVESWTFSVITQQTVGYGNTGPQRCWASTWVVVCQGITSTILSSIVVGIFFARVSQPMQRARSMYMSEQSVIARRDGALKFMFRVADVRDTQVVEPHLKAFLYTWGPGRITAEGEKIPVRCEALGIGYVDGMLLLPLTVEHLIDERSPLCGHTRSSLVALDAEIVVTLEGTTEFGNPFMARRSYLATEILWGEEFADILELPEAFGADYDRSSGLSFRRLFRRSLDAQARGLSRLPSHSPGAPQVALSPSELPSGGAASAAPAPFALRNRPPPDCAGRCRIRTRVNLEGFHASQLQRDLPRRAPDEVADLVVSQALESVPYPLLNENTLCLSQWLVVRPGPGPGSLVLQCRVGDTYPSHMTRVRVQVFLFRWRGDGEGCLPCERAALDVGYDTGEENLHLRLPVDVTHVVDDASPLAPWRRRGGVELDARSEITVVLFAEQFGAKQVVLRQRTYVVGQHVRWGHRFAEAVRAPSRARERKPSVRWAAFHQTLPLEDPDCVPGGVRSCVGRPRGDRGAPPAPLAPTAARMQVAPESHASRRAQGARELESGAVPGAGSSPLMRNVLSLWRPDSESERRARPGVGVWRRVQQLGRSLSRSSEREVSAKAAGEPLTAVHEQEEEEEEEESLESSKKSAGADEADEPMSLQARPEDSLREKVYSFGASNRYLTDVGASGRLLSGYLPSHVARLSDGGTGRAYSLQPSDSLQPAPSLRPRTRSAVSSLRRLPSASLFQRPAPPPRPAPRRPGDDGAAAPPRVPQARGLLGRGVLQLRDSVRAMLSTTSTPRETRGEEGEGGRREEERESPHGEGGAEKELDAEEEERETWSREGGEEPGAQQRLDLHLSPTSASTTFISATLKGKEEAIRPDLPTSASPPASGLDLTASSPYASAAGLPRVSPCSSGAGLPRVSPYASAAGLPAAAPHQPGPHQPHESPAAALSPWSRWREDGAAADATRARAQLLGLDVSGLEAAPGASAGLAGEEAEQEPTGEEARDMAELRRLARRLARRRDEEARIARRTTSLQDLFKKEEEEQS